MNYMLISKKHSAASLHIIANENIPPLAFAMLLLHGKCVENLVLFLHDLRVVWVPVVNVACGDLPSYLWIVGKEFDCKLIDQVRNS